jgi:hypothetical protein
MRRSALYSRSPRRDAAESAPAPAAASPSPCRPPRARARFAFAQRHERWLALVAGLVIGALALAV